MGLIDRLVGRRSRGKESIAGSIQPTAPQVRVLNGDEDLEVVGESNYQPALWAICGKSSGERVRHHITAVLVPEPHNIHDSNAVAVYIGNNLVGYLDRQTAALYAPAVQRLRAEHSAYIGLNGVIVGGGYYDDGPGRLGVWLEHDPADFGIQQVARRERSSAQRPVPAAGAMRTGFSEAWLTDADDDSYDLSWYNELPDADRPAIMLLHELLAVDPDPIDRHFQFAELEARLYRCRDLYESALDEFDEVCRRHDAEMETICQAFVSKWSKVPLLETYRQMAIRQQKKRDWQACLWWVERGLSLYGNAAAREDAVEDLLKRRNRARDKIEAGRTPNAVTRSAPSVVEISLSPSSLLTTPPSATAVDVEVLHCGQCHSTFERLRVRGRKPQLCPACRAL
jgi:hypothetical protein